MLTDLVELAQLAPQIVRYVAAYAETVAHDVRDAIDKPLDRLVQRIIGEDN
jgi:hypothetical protein